MGKPELSDFGLDKALVTFIRVQISHYEKAQGKITTAIFLICYSVVVLAMWPLAGWASLFMVVPAIALGTVIVWVSSPLRERYRLKKLKSVRGYEDLCKFEADMLEYRSRRNAAELKEQSEKAARELQERRKSWTYWSRLAPNQFEYEVAAVFRSHGYKATVTPGSGDGGVDIVLKKESATIYVQCK